MRRPALADVSRKLICDKLNSLAFAILISAPVQREDCEIPCAGVASNPAHPMRSRFVRQQNWRPSLGAIRRRDQVEHRSTADSISGVPTSADGNLRFPVACEVSRSQADVIALS